MISVKNLKYSYGKQEVLKGVSFEIRAGEIVVLVGKNGSGKSTLGKLVTGILRPHAHEVTIDGIDVGVKRNYQKVFEKIGIVFQNPEAQIIFNNIQQEMEFALQNTAETEKAIDAALKSVGMDTKRKDNLWDFSLGQKQRVVLAEMLARRPKYLVLDEPTTMIDSDGKERIWEILRRLRERGLGILLATNSAEELLLADRVLVLADGEIKANICGEDLVKKAEILEKYKVRLPQLLRFVRELRRDGIEIRPEQWTPERVAEEIRKLC